MASKHQQREHAILAPSSAARWGNCTPSARLSEGVGKSVSSIYADEGTLAHEYSESEILFRLGKIGEQKRQETLDRLRSLSFTYDGVGRLLFKEKEAEIISACESYITNVIELFNSVRKLDANATILVEQKLPIQHITFEQGAKGSGDVVIIGAGMLKIIDLKFGKGVQVYAYHNVTEKRQFTVRQKKDATFDVLNPQLGIYAAGALRKYELIYDIKKVEMIIYQPRLDWISSYELPANLLTQWVEQEVQPQAKLALVGEGTLTIGEWCKFCPVKPTCSALYNEAEVITASLPKGKFRMSNAEIAHALKLVPVLEDWAKEVKNYALQQMLDGKAINGYKVVYGRASRVWNDEVLASMKLKKLGYAPEEIFNTKLKGITDIEKLVGKKEFTDLFKSYVDKPQGSPTIALADDAREAITQQTVAGNDFENELKRR